MTFKALLNSVTFEEVAKTNCSHLSRHGTMSWMVQDTFRFAPFNDTEVSRRFQC